MTDMTKEEAQAMINAGAPKLWDLEKMIKETGDEKMGALVSELHKMAAALIECHGYEVPQSESGGPK